MTADVIHVSLQTRGEDAIRTLIDNSISGLPVVDDAGTVAGIVSEFQLLEVVYDARVKDMPVSELMTTEVLTVEGNTPLADVVSLFVMHRIRRLPVIQDGKLAGIVSRGDILRYALNAAEGRQSADTEAAAPA